MARTRATKGNPASHVAGQPNERRLVRALGWPAAASIVVGIVIGSGIFRTPDLVAREVGTTGLILLVWIIGGLLVLAGALSYAELGAMMPNAGGAYVYMREAYGPLPAFLTGWASLISNNTAALAAVASFFGEMFTDVFGLPRDFGPWDDGRARIVAIAGVMGLTWANVRGVRVGGNIQIVFTALKLGALAFIVLVGFALAGDGAARLTPVWPATWSLGLVESVGIAMVAVLFTYDGWTNANNVAEEIKNPGRNLPKALLLGTLLVTFVYVVANLCYMWVLSAEGLAGAGGRTAAATMTETVGRAGATFVTGAILISLFGTLNGQCLAYPRIYFAMARDRLFFRAAAEVHPRFHTPHFSLAIQAVLAVLFILWVDYEFLINLVIFSAFLFYAAAVGAVFVLRRKRPDLPRPYRTWGYPWVPAAFIALSAVFLVISFAEAQTARVDLGFVEFGVKASVLGLLVILAGVPVYYLWARHMRHAHGLKVETKR